MMGTTGKATFTSDNYLTVEGTCSDNSLPEADLTGIEFNLVEVSANYVYLETIISVDGFSINQNSNQIEVDISQVYLLSERFDQNYMFTYNTLTTDWEGKLAESENTIEFQVIEYYSYCDQALSVPADGTFDTDILFGDIQYINLEEISNDDCEFELEYSVDTSAL